MDIFAYDFDGVVSIGIRPRNSDDVIITGRCIEESHYVFAKLKELNIQCTIYFNPMSLSDRGTNTIDSRIYSGRHKAKTISDIIKDGVVVTRFFDDDPIQIEIMKHHHENIEFVQINSTLVKY